MYIFKMISLVRVYTLNFEVRFTSKNKYNIWIGEKRIMQNCAVLVLVDSTQYLVLYIHLRTDLMTKTFFIYRSIYNTWFSSNYL